MLLPSHRSCSIFSAHGTRSFCASERRSDSAVLEQIGDQAAQHRAAMIRLLTEL